MLASRGQERCDRQIMIQEIGEEGQEKLKRAKTFISGVNGFDLIVDAMDNLKTRYLLNKSALYKNAPFFHAAVL